MKIIINENQLKKITEQELYGYDSAKIDDFISDVKKHIHNLEQKNQIHFNKLLKLNVNDIVNNLDATESFINKLKEYVDFLRKVYDKYYDVVDLYKIGSYPDNIIELSKLINELDSLTNDLDSILTFYDEFYTNVKFFVQVNKHKFKNNNI